MSTRDTSSSWILVVVLVVVTTCRHAPEQMATATPSVDVTANTTHKSDFHPTVEWSRYRSNELFDVSLIGSDDRCDRKTVGDDDQQEVSIDGQPIRAYVTGGTFDREIIWKNCKECDSDRIVITHGTDTMAATTRYLGERIEGKTIVLTGAMIPYTFGSSDGLFNLGSAIAFAQACPRIKTEKRNSRRALLAPILRISPGVVRRNRRARPS